MWAYHLDMKRPTDAPEIEHLIAVCLELYESTGPVAVDRLLADHPDSSQFVRERLDLLGRMGLVGEAPKESRPERIGEYEIVGVLGRGGMGVVYEARQERPQRHVALKVLRALPARDGRDRFRDEAELLGRLQHPGIAQVYEVGSAQVGGMTMPYFAMELVRGRPIDAWCQEQKLDVRAKLELVAKVADAVHHAHQKGVVHRDLKPANLLVDERGAPRVLDFGIARTIDPDLELETLRTEVGQLIGTLAFMSPEQALGNPRDIDSRTDVYSLGVVAYELLTGQLPHDPTDKTVLEALRAIQEEEPAPLSQFDRSLRGDVETIVAKALAKEKERRYDSAAEFAADLRRYLRDEPITARPATALYQLTKFARRHRALVAGAAAVVVALLIGLAGTLKGMVDAAAERDDAERRFRLASAMLDFQKRMFAAADPDQAGVLVEDLLDRGALLLDESEDPVERAALRLMVGESYESVGLYDKAEPLIAGAVESFESELGRGDLQTLSARIALAELYVSRLLRLDNAEAALEGVEGTASRVHGPAHRITLRARLTRARIEFERDNHADAVRIARDVLALVGDDRGLWADAMHRLALSLEKLSQKEEALAVAIEIRDWSLAHYGTGHPATWSAMNTYGNMLRDLGRVEEGRDVLDELVALRTEHLGRLHPDTINAQSNLGICCVQLGDLDRAEALLTEVVAVCDERYPAVHPERLFALNTLASTYMMRGQTQRAEPVFGEVVELLTTSRGRDHIDTTTAMGNWAKALGFVGRPDEAEALFTETLDLRMQKLGDRHIQTLITMTMFASFLTGRGRFDEADVLLYEAAELGREALADDDYTMSQILRAYGQNLIQLERFAEAEAPLLESYERGERARPGHAENRSAMQMLQGVQARLGR